MALLHLNEVESTGGPAADTGSLTHAAVEHWHREKDVGLSLAYMRERQAEFPKGDAKEAERYFTLYAADPRNQEAKIVHLEMPILFKIDNDPDDPYGPIYIQGQLDQIREDRVTGEWSLWDLKTGDKYSGYEMLHVYAAQQAAYCIGASTVLNRPVHPGGIIRAYGYRVRGAALPSPGGVFFHTPWDLGDCSQILRPIRRRVLEIRAGSAEPVAGEQCTFCPANGLQNCLVRYKRGL